MTMQMLDSFSYQGKRVEAIAISRRFSFTPANSFGIATAAWGTANYRGFWCDYVIDEMFVLSNLYLFSKTYDYPAINGRNAEEIPEFVRILEQINSKAKEERRYIDGFPMQYKGIDQEKNKFRQERYRKVYELLFDEGVLADETDITALWKKVCKKQKEQPEEYWWEAKDKNYFNLINYAFMGVSSELNESYPE